MIWKDKGIRALFAIVAVLGLIYVGFLIVRNTVFKEKEITNISGKVDTMKALGTGSTQWPVKLTKGEHYIVYWSIGGKESNLFLKLNNADSTKHITFVNEGGYIYDSTKFEVEEDGQYYFNVSTPYNNQWALRLKY